MLSTTITLFPPIYDNFVPIVIVTDPPSTGFNIAVPDVLYLSPGRPVGPVGPVIPVGPV